MKSRRLTILCVGVLALAITPRAWQEVGKLLAVVQHKAQVKFWSMVLQPRSSESANRQLVAAARPFDAGLDSNCPLERTKSQDYPASGKSQAGRRVNSASSQPKARARQAASAPASHASLIARSFKADSEKSVREGLRDLKVVPEIRPSELAGNWMTPPAPHVATPKLPPPPASKRSDTFRFVMIPATSPVASAFFEKENIVQFKVLKKTLEGNRLPRLRGSLPVSRSVAAFPSS